MKRPAILSKILRSIYLILNIGVAIWLFLCKWASVHNPAQRPTLLSLISFSCMFAVLANLIFIISWLISRKKWRALLSLLTIVLCWNVARPLFAFNFFGKNKITADAGGLKIMTWNVHMFDLGEWTKDKTSRAKIIKLIKDESPDILCLQEFYWNKDEETEPYTAILQQLGYPFVEFSVENTMHKRTITSSAGKNEIIYTGHAIFSKYPLRNEQKHVLYHNYNMLSVEVVVDSEHIFSLNVTHLTSVGFGRKEMDYIEEVKAEGVDAQEKSKSKSLLRKLYTASAKRADLANQIDSIKRHMDYPIIICGDFNDVPGSYVYDKVRGKLSDAFIARGSGIGRTYQHIFPTLRIDYIFYDNTALSAEGFERPDVGLSDHYPIIANFSLRNK